LSQVIRPPSDLSNAQGDLSFPSKTAAAAAV
jgi:hypothetical protein